MRIIKNVFPVFATAVATVALFMTLGLLSGNSIMYAIALWMFALLTIGFVLVLMRGYQRIVNRVGTANERLTELKFLQERRYDQLRRRMDYLNDSLNVLHRNVRGLDTALGNVPRAPQTSNAFAELDNLNARLQRSERRILGKLENEQFSNHQLHQRLVELLESMDDNAASTSTHPDNNM